MTRSLVRGAGVVVAALGAALVMARRGHRPPTIHDTSGMVVLVTGANSGIGLETAAALAAGGARVLMTARDRGRGEAAVAELRRRVPGADMELVLLDLSSLASVRRCADDVRSRIDRLDVLVNNAGLVVGERSVTEDGFETTIGVNHLGPFLLTNLLLDLLVDSAPSRIVTVASTAHRQAAMDLDDLMVERRPYRPMTAYGTSKLANILFTTELARRLEGTGVIVNCCHPGTVRSGFGRNADSHPLLRLGLAIAARFFVDAERGAATSVHLAASPEVTTSGAYHDRSRPTTPSRSARDPILARRLWDRSVALVGIGPDDQVGGAPRR